MPAAPRDLATKVEAIAHRYPDRRSLTLPALRFAQEEHGWLPPEALREVAEVLDLTPAYCEAVASFYDMFHLAPVGRHMVEICTNLSCALVGAQRVVEAFESTLGVKAGETTEDGMFSLSEVECLGSCGTAPMMQIGFDYYENLTDEKVDEIIDKCRRGELSNGVR